MVKAKKKTAGRAITGRRAKTKVEYKVDRATSVDAAKIHRILVLIEEIRRRIRRRKWIYGYPVKDPVERIGTRYEAALKDLAVVSKQMESVVRREIKKNR